MSAKIYSVQAGINTCYIIRDRGTIMVDAGFPNFKTSFIKQTRRLKIDPRDIRLIILTHGDFDHVGSAKDLRELSGAKVAIHEKDSNNLENGLFNWTRGVTSWGKISRSILMPMIRHWGTFPSMKADIILDDEAFDLKDYGINGRIIYTPGHTMGSVSVLLDSGELFAGCLAHNRLPFTLHPALPIYAENLELIKESWRKLIDAGAKTVYPGHGKPFPSELIKKYLN